MIKKETIRQYRYIWPEHTMIREKVNSEKIRVDNGGTFTSSLEKNVFASRYFMFLWEVSDDVKVVETKKETKETKVETKDLSKEKAVKLYQEKFWKKPFHWWSAEQILSKLS